MIYLRQFIRGYRNYSKLMKNEIIFKEQDWENGKSVLISGREDESALVFFCKAIKTAKMNRYIVVDALSPDSKDLPIRNPGYVRLGPKFMEGCFQKCEREGLHMIDTHTHPFADWPTFSSIDNQKDAQIKGPYMNKYVPGVELLFIVCGKNPDKLDARMWDNQSHSLKQIDLVKII
jgi:hypothetical protein